MDARARRAGRRRDQPARNLAAITAGRRSSFGVNYDGSPIGSGKASAPGLAPPLHHWTPSIAPSGMAFLTSDRLWRGVEGQPVFVGSLKMQAP